MKSNSKIKLQQWGPVVVGRYVVTVRDAGGVPAFQITRRDLPTAMQVPGDFSLDEADQLIDVLTEATNWVKDITELPHV